MPTWTSTGSIRGPQGLPGPAGSPGPAGPAGPAGPQGPAGMGLQFHGSVPTFADLPTSGREQGDAYLVADENDKLYVWDAEANGGAGDWVDGGSIQGPPGPPGVAGESGPRGTRWFTGEGDPPAVIEGALEGDIYLDLISGVVHTLSPTPEPVGFPIADLPAIGSPFQGGYYGGLISLSGNGVATHALVIAPKASGETYLPIKTSNTVTAGTSSLFDGWANTEASSNASHPASQWARSLTIGGYSDWYVPALYELEILFRVFKPDNNEGNDSDYGTNPYAVPPTGNYTLGVPDTTTIAAFVLGGAEAMFAGEVRTSSQDSATTVISHDWYYGGWGPVQKTTQGTLRAIRRIAVRP